MEESKANLAVVQAHIQSCDLDDAAMVSTQALPCGTKTVHVQNTVKLIAATNIRHLQNAMSAATDKVETVCDRGGYGIHSQNDANELAAVVEEWRRVSSPLPRLVVKVRCTQIRIFK